MFLTVAVEIFESEFNNCRSTVIELVESADLDACLLAIRVAGSFNVLYPGDVEKLQAATQKAWREVLTNIKATSPSVIASEKLSKLAYYVHVFVDQQFTDVIPLITAALKDEHQGIALSYLRTLLKLAADYFVKRWCKSCHE
ncbi:hypothetical protein B0H14DRAFT_2641495 [Mycena olivaceomarginata]|nr:hypothetical protein B0H14DRAFT_2641495 [Mycena olivaceomarginata]